ncbi:MAG TPA: acyl-ACP thioesterase domain-containing protein [Anaerolineaceae bacterium]|nr:acyl-ACP thioesterase domain-containing protein [Anaerolineaceae bacterium]
MERYAIFTFETSVKSYETDFQGSWKPACLIQNLIKAASDHASLLGFDYAVLLERGLVWVLARLKIRFFEIPTLKQAVTIKTWPKGIEQKLFFMRDFDVRGADNRPLVTASLAWLLMNPKTRRILSPQALGGSVPDNGGLSSLDELLEKIELPDGLLDQLTVKANYSAVDLLGHANAARYVEWVCDCFLQEQYQLNRLDWLQINYSHETKPGETLSIMTGCANDDPFQWFIQGTNQTRDLKAFEAALGWVKR